MSLSASFYDAANHGTFFFPAAVCFTISDGFLAYDFFVRKIKAAGLIVFPFYFAAQLLIAMSTIFLSSIG